MGAPRSAANAQPTIARDHLADVAMPDIVHFLDVHTKAAAQLLHGVDVGVCGSLDAIHNDALEPGLDFCIERGQRARRRR